ncbi:MarR family transcriptional regulator [Candidatus Acetothermia bacterium]|nr:MAG: MarR family transcriptional regulator [Candidatus Acetothermia bacterium]
MGDADRPTVGHLLSRICRLTRGRLRVKMEAIGLHRGQGLVLSYLWHNDGIPSADIARALRISPATVTNMIKRMERGGWIERRPDPEDQRVLRVHLTDKARSLKEEVRASFRELEEEITGVLTEEEEEALLSILAKVHSRLLDVSGGPGEGER